MTVRVCRALVHAVAALALGLGLLPGLAGAQSHVAQNHVEGQLNHAKAAMQLKKYDEAAAGCQLRANTEGRAVTCLVPGVDWNPKTWESC